MTLKEFISLLETTITNLKISMQEELNKISNNPFHFESSYLHYCKLFAIIQKLELNLRIVQKEGFDFEKYKESKFEAMCEYLIENDTAINLSTCATSITLVKAKDDAERWFFRFLQDNLKLYKF